MRSLRPSGLSTITLPVKIGSVLAAALLLLSCNDDASGPGTGSGEIVFPESDVSYGEHVQPLFDRRCASSGCHDSGTRAGDLSLESYTDATARPGIIIPGNPDVSVLVQTIEGTLPIMPPLNSPPLTDNQIKGIRRWILEGAENN